MTSTRIIAYSRRETAIDRYQRIMTALSTSLQPANDSEAYRLAETLLRPRFHFLDALSIALALNPNTKQIADDHKRQKDQTRAQLLTLPLEELRRRVAQQEAQAAANRAAQIENENKRQQEKVTREARAAAAKEAAKFYNQESSKADFTYWTTMDYWTFDEALALLMGMDPRVMTRAAIKKELEPEFSFMLGTPPKKPTSEFIRRYDDLYTVAKRATVMKPAQLRPVDVVVWAGQSGAITPPDGLVKALLARVKRSQPQTLPAAEPPASTNEVSVPPSAPSSTPMKRAALIQKHERAWPTIEADLRHSNENGLAACAKAEKHGYWFEEPALHWASQNGKRSTTSRSAGLINSAFSRIHRLSD